MRDLRYSLYGLSGSQMDSDEQGECISYIYASLPDIGDVVRSLQSACMRLLMQCGEPGNSGHAASAKPAHIILSSQSATSYYIPHVPFVPVAMLTMSTLIQAPGVPSRKSFNATGTAGWPAPELSGIAHATVQPSLLSYWQSILRLGIL